MSWRITKDLEEYLAEAGDFLRSDPAGNTVPLSVTETLRAQGTDAYGGAAAEFGWWRTGDGDVGGVFLHTRPHPPLLSAMPEHAARELAEVLAAGRVSLAGVNADQNVAQAFARAWERRTGAVSEVLMRQRLYRLDRLEAPHPLPEGTPRVAAVADHGLVLAWFQAFHQEAASPGGVNSTLVEDKISYGGVTLWEVDGVPVSLAGRTRVVAGMVRVAPVYTPPAHRRRGYGAAVTAHITRAAMNAGAHEVVLFTDLDNATSNGIYQRLGYRPVSDQLMLAFPGPRSERG